MGLKVNPSLMPTHPLSSGVLALTSQKTQASALAPSCTAISICHMTDILHSSREVSAKSRSACKLPTAADLAGGVLRRAVVFPGMQEAAPALFSAPKGLPTPPSASLAALHSMLQASQHDCIPHKVLHTPGWPACCCAKLGASQAGHLMQELAQGTVHGQRSHNALQGQRARQQPGGVGRHGQGRGGVAVLLSWLRWGIQIFAAGLQLQGRACTKMWRTITMCGMLPWHVLPL